MNNAALRRRIEILVETTIATMAKIHNLSIEKVQSELDNGSLKAKEEFARILETLQNDEQFNNIVFAQA